MKKLFEYPLITKVKEKIVTKNEDGSELTNWQEVDKTVKVFIKEPGRKDVESARNIYQEAWSDAVRRGILTRAIIDKTYSNNQGFLSEIEKKDLEVAGNKMIEIREKYLALDFRETPDEDKNPEQKEIIENLSDEFIEAQKSFNRLEQINESLYRNSAESIAADKQILFNTLFLSYIEKDGKVEPLVAGETLEDKLNKYDGILEDQSSDAAKEKSRLYNEILQRNGYFVTLLAGGKIDPVQLNILNEKIDSGEIKL